MRLFMVILLNKHRRIIHTASGGKDAGQKSIPDAVRSGQAWHDLS